MNRVATYKELDSYFQKQSTLFNVNLLVSVVNLSTDKEISRMYNRCLLSHARSARHERGAWSAECEARGSRLAFRARLKIKRYVIQAKSFHSDGSFSPFYMFQPCRAYWIFPDPSEAKREGKNERKRNWSTLYLGWCPGCNSCIFFFFFLSYFIFRMEKLTLNSSLRFCLQKLKCLR